MPLIATSLRYAYPVGNRQTQVALDDVSLELVPGTVTLIMGQTGSGKSTLLKVLAGLLDPSSGSALLDGKKIEPGDVGLVFQQPESQLFAETVLEDVMFGPKNRDASDEEAKKAALDALRLVSLDPEVFAQRSPFSLSGGQARKAALAGVLAMRPSVLLMDEPTAGLDRAGRESVRELITTLRAEGVALAVVSHTAEEVLPFADKVMLLQTGRTVFLGTADEIVERPEYFREAGIAPPPLLDLQSKSKEAGLRLESYMLEPHAVATMLLAAHRLEERGA